MFQKLAKDEAGSVGIIFGLTIIPVIFLAGAAIDYTIASGGRSTLQRTLDRAALAGVKAVGSELSTAQATFADEAKSANLTNPTSNFTFDSTTGQMTGTASTTMPSPFMGLFLNGPVKVSANVLAQQKGMQTPTNITIALTIARGWYWKRLTIYKQDTPTSTPVSLGTLTYQPTNLQNGGTGTLSDQNGQTLTPGSTGTTFSVGTNYNALYLQMDVSSDGCGPNMVPKSAQSGNNTNFSCQAATNNNKKSSSAMYSFKTNDTASAGQLFTSATQISATTINSAISAGKNTQTLFTKLTSADVSNVSSIFQCGKTTTQAWEDTVANTSPLNSSNSWWTQDIYFDITVPSCSYNTNYNTVTRIVN